MYLGQDKRPADALQLAREAVDVWADWMDANVVEPPDIEPPDFAQTMRDTMDQVTATLMKARPPGSAWMPDGPIDPEFIPAALPETPASQGQDGPTKTTYRVHPSPFPKTLDELTELTDREDSEYAKKSTEGV